MEAIMNVNPGSPTQRIPSHNPDQQAPATTGVANNVDAADMAAIMAALQVAQTQAAPEASGYHEKMEFVIEHVPNSMESICGDEEIKAQLNQIAAIIKDMDPREVEIKVFSPCTKELGKLRGRAVKAYLKEQGVSEDLLDVKLRGPGRHNKHFGLAKERGIIIELYPKEPGASQRSAPIEPGHIRV